MDNATFDGGWFEVLAHPRARPGWYISVDDEVAWEHDDRLDDLAEALNHAAGVTNAFREDREVILVEGAITGPAIVAWICHWWSTGSALRNDLADPGSDRAPGPTGPVGDDDAARLVTGDARLKGHPAQIWVNQEGLLVLPAQSITHGPLDPTDNPRFQRTNFTAAQALGLAELHAGRWLPYPQLAKLRLRRPGPFRRHWSVTIHERGGTTVSFQWRGTRAHAALLWAYVVAKLGIDRVDGRP